jgi:ubiquinone/menaquinone biosynthesis C-methylase UbiE
VQDRLLAARRAAARGLGQLERVAATARRRVEEGTGWGGAGSGSGRGVGTGAGDGRADRSAAGPDLGRYGRLWDPPADREAMALILNTTDGDEFERTGRADADRLATYVPAGGTALDVGCGIGRVARYLAPQCGTLWAVDASPRMLELAGARLAELPNVRFARCVDTDIPDVPTASVDLAYALLVLQHLEREDAYLLLEELHRVVKPSGVAFVTFPNLLSDAYLAAFMQYARTGETANPARARMYTPQEVGRLLPAAGFDVDIEAGVEIVAVCHPR